MSFGGSVLEPSVVGSFSFISYSPWVFAGELIIILNVCERHIGWSIIRQIELFLFKESHVSIVKLALNTATVVPLLLLLLSHLGLVMVLRNLTKRSSGRYALAKIGFSNIFPLSHKISIVVSVVCSFFTLGSSVCTVLTGTPPLLLWKAIIIVVSIGNQ